MVSAAWKDGELDYYGILGLDRGALPEEVKTSYRRLALLYHPDKNREDDKVRAEEMFKLISEAFQVLSDPEKRQVYDSFGKKGLDGDFGTPPDFGGGFTFVVDAHMLFRKVFGEQDVGDAAGMAKNGLLDGPLQQLRRSCEERRRCEVIHPPSAVGLVFPGEGSQRMGMLDWASEHERAALLIDSANEVLGYDLLEISAFGPEEELDQPDISQPVIFVAGMCGFEWLKDHERKRDLGLSAVAGMSCGELAALCAAGCLDFEDGVLLARVQGELVRAAVIAGGGEPQKMISVTGVDEVQIDKLCAMAVNERGGVCQVGSRLFPRAFAISGTAAAVNRLKELAWERGAQKVSEIRGCKAGFHTELMKPAEEALRRHLDELVSTKKLRTPQVAVYSSRTGAPWLPGEAAPVEIADGIARALTSAHSWEDACRSMIADGVERFWEIGAKDSRQLTGIMRHIDVERWKMMRCVECQ